MSDNLDGYEFVLHTFEYGGGTHKVAIMPVVFNDGEGLDFTGSYLGTILSFDKGSRQFVLELEGDSWSVEPKGMDPGLVEELGRLIHSTRK